MPFCHVEMAMQSPFNIHCVRKQLEVRELANTECQLKADRPADSGMLTSILQTEICQWDLCHQSLTDHSTRNRFGVKWCCEITDTQQSSCCIFDQGKNGPEPMMLEAHKHKAHLGHNFQLTVLQHKKYLLPGNITEQPAS